MIKAVLTLVTLSLGLSAATAQAGYFRFWQGNAKPGITPGQFVKNLNQGLLPATGRLARTQARLQSYQPVILPAELIRAGLPAEVALVEYANEAGYSAFRATPEGKAYGDLHWESFNPATSKSVVPEPYRGRIEGGHAYDVTGANVDWYRGYASFRIYARERSSSNARYAEGIRSHIDHLLANRVRGLVVLVMPGYVMEYSLWENAAFQRHSDETTSVRVGGRGRRDEIRDLLVEAAGRLVMDAPLRTGVQATFGTGVRYRLR